MTVRCVSRSKRYRIYARDGNRCLLCDSKDNLTIDHVVPLSIGGNNNLNNLQTLCHTCNQKKAAVFGDYRKAFDAPFSMKDFMEWIPKHRKQKMIDLGITFNYFRCELCPKCQVPWANKADLCENTACPK